jgi:thiol-disulfide isomerase/thioredoxin
MLKKIIIGFVIGFLLSVCKPVIAQEKNINLYLFHSSGCPHCAKEISFLENIETRYKELKITKFEISKKQG